MHADNIEPRADLGQLSALISRQIVQLHARLYGRGPTRAKTYITADYALAVLEEIFTPAERTLIAAGKGEHVHPAAAVPRHAAQPRLRGDAEGDAGRAAAGAGLNADPP